MGSVGRLGGIGIGYRPWLAPALFIAPGSVDFLEVLAEGCRGTRARREVMALSEAWPVVPHGVKLSLGSAEGIEVDRARELGRLARELRSPLVTEHVAFVRARGREIGHLTELPLSRDAVHVVARNVARLRRELPDVPLLLENVARGFLWTGEEMSEGDFYCEIVRATGCDLLLDVANLFANAINSGRDPDQLLSTFPMDRVGLVHVAGGAFDDGFYFDTHAHPVPEAVFQLTAAVTAARPGVPVVLERDAALVDVASIFAEVARLRAMAGSPPRRDPNAGAQPVLTQDADVSALASMQAELAELLTAPEGSSHVNLVRARGVLRRKAAQQALARASARDALVHRARFTAGATGPKPRFLPFVGRERSCGTTTWAFKGLGCDAAVRVLERGASR